MNVAQGRRRGFKSWFVEPYRQIKLGLVFVVINLIFSALILLVFGYFLWDMYGAMATYYKLSPGELNLIVAKFTWPVAVGCGLLALFLVMTVLMSVRYTHEIYGPLVSIHRHLDLMLDGQVAEPLQLRESDQLKDLADKLNTVAERLGSEKRAGALGQVHRYLDQVLSDGYKSPLTLRDGDQLQELADKISKLAAAAAGK